jgi:hypothetical protein
MTTLCHGRKVGICFCHLGSKGLLALIADLRKDLAQCLCPDEWSLEQISNVNLFALGVDQVSGFVPSHTLFGWIRTLVRREIDDNVFKTEPPSL